MIYKTIQQDDITIYYVKKDYDDITATNLLNTYPDNIEFIIRHNSDVYTEDGKLLLRFRKNVLKKEYIDLFYDNVISFANTKTNNRGSACGSTNKNVYQNPQIRTNIIGYFDTLSPIQKYLMKQKSITIDNYVRPCRFNLNYPKKYQNIIPLIQEIDSYYQLYIPDCYQKQKMKADETHFKIENTSFTTITVNLNYQTSLHVDKGDDQEGFGNLTVIENGDYLGGETIFHQYGIGVDVRTGDILFMDVHQIHGNLPIQLIDENAKRLSIVCYLRKNVYEKTKNKTLEFFNQQIEIFRRIKKN
jgi:hypothetical protein